MKTIAAELGELGIRVNALLPGMVDGPKMQGVIAAKAAAAGVDPAEVLRCGFAGSSIKKLDSPDGVAATALFLASRAAGSISGQAIGGDS